MGRRVNISSNRTKAVVIAEALGSNPNTVYTWIVSGELKAKIVAFAGREQVKALQRRKVK